MAGRFRIYYGDGATYSDRDGSPYDAPAVNVQIIAVEDAASPEGFYLTHGNGLRAYFCYAPDPGVWHCADEAGFYDYLMFGPGPKKVLFGRTLHRDSDYWAIRDRAIKEGLG